MKQHQWAAVGILRSRVVKSKASGTTGFSSEMAIEKVAVAFAKLQQLTRIFEGESGVIEGMSWRQQLALMK
jgi:hypothetical protein